MTQTKIILEPAYILHSRPYRDTSLIVDFLTFEHGRLSAVARGAKSIRSSIKGLLQPFVPLLLSCQGKGDLLTVTQIEANGAAHTLNSHCLLGGLYLNEMLTKLLGRNEAMPELFSHYHNALSNLTNLPKEMARTLRHFEQQLLQDLGYAIALDRETLTGTAISPEHWYYFDLQSGIRFANQSIQESQENNHFGLFQGKSLLAIHHNHWEEITVLSDAKRLYRLALNELLGNRPLKTRGLFKVKIQNEHK